MSDDAEASKTALIEALSDALSFHQYRTWTATAIATWAPWHVSQNYQSCCCDGAQRTMVDQLEHIADALIERLGLAVEEDTGAAEVTAVIVTDDPAEAERFVEAVAEYAMGLSNDAMCVGRMGAPAKPRTRFATPWIEAS